MILEWLYQKDVNNSFPRPRGGDPGFTPEAIRADGLFPAHAGVILEWLYQKDVNNSFPRLRGGDPPIYGASDTVQPFSPPARG